MRDIVALDAEASDGSTECACPVEQKPRTNSTMAAKQKSMSTVSPRSSSPKKNLRRTQSSKSDATRKESKSSSSSSSNQQPRSPRVKKAKKVSKDRQTVTPIRSSRSNLRSSMKKKTDSPSKMSSLEATLSSGRRTVKRRNSVGSSVCESITRNESTTRSNPKKEGPVRGRGVQRCGSMDIAERETLLKVQQQQQQPQQRSASPKKRDRQSKSPRKKRPASPIKSIRKSQSPSSDKSKPKVVKNVSFRDVLVTDTVENTHMDEEEVKELWYDKYEVEYFKGELEAIVEKITTKLVKRTESWRKSLMRAYDMSCSADSDDCFQDTRSATYKLVTFRLKDVYAETAQLVGLEHLLAHDIRFDGNRRRGRILDLMDKQRDDREKRNRLHTSMEGDDTADSNKLCEESMEASRASRFFAHGVAVARVSVKN